MQPRERLFRDPVAFFLALAFTDNAIKGVSSIEQFWSIQPRKGQKSFQFEWNTDKLHVPVFRIITAIGPTLAFWTCSSMFHYLGIITKNAGYQLGLNHHSYYTTRGYQLDRQYDSFLVA